MPSRQLFKEPPCSLCLRRDDWIFECRSIKDRFVEIILKRKHASKFFIRSFQVLLLAVFWQFLYTTFNQSIAIGISILLLCVWIFRINSEVIEERILAVRDLGLSISTHFASGKVTRRFIDANSIQSIIMNEGFKNCGVYFYLACIVADCNKLQLLFPEARPRLPVVARIYKELSSILH